MIWSLVKRSHQPRVELSLERSQRIRAKEKTEMRRGHMEVLDEDIG
jgi:hypothetical protein